VGGRSLVVFFVLVLTCVLTSFSQGEAQGVVSARPSSWGHARIVERDGHSVFEVDGKPFFLYGAAFFYERLPRDQWSSSMDALAAMGINTLDLYVPWNWHELSDGDFDFTGRTSPRRDFDEVLRLAKLHDFEIILRPGPVVRNEWRNGGYPAWLLQRPDYDMPLHDILEGRYPSTATLQNAHSDAAAAEWMRNATHVTYAKRWLERVLAETAPYADRVLAVALDDDQGAYIDNQTYPAPHFQAYIGWLRDVVHGVTGPRELTFINTYQMKVPASSPVWAMGNWYQSDAYAIGTHDESQLAFSFAQLATRPHQPLFASEFQAGWLQGAGEAYPRAADPSNTQLALATMIGTGVRGVVNFPAQDTLNPTGWEAPFANFAYAWDAAIRLDRTESGRYWPTASFGGLVATFGPMLATSFPRFDASIVYAGGNVAAAASGGSTFAQIASADIDAQQACRAAGYACNLVDLSATNLTTLAHGTVVLVPAYDVGTQSAIGPSLERTLDRLRSMRGVVVRRIANVADVRAAMRGRAPIVENVDDAVFSESLNDGAAGFLSVTNYSSLARVYRSASVSLSSGKRIALAPFTVPAHSAFVSPVDVRLSRVFGSAFANTDVLRSTDCSPLAWQHRGRDITATFTESVSDAPLGRPRRPDRECAVNVLANGKPHTYHLNESSDVYAIDPTVEQPKGYLPGQFDSYIFERPIPTVPFRPDFGLLAPMRVDSNAKTFAPPSVRRSDVFAEGSDAIVFDDGATDLVVAPDAGARAFLFRAHAPDAQNWFTTVGGLRDDVAVESPLSTKDRIAKYTHDFPAGTFNRTYAVSDIAAGGARFSYAAPDVIPLGATFDRTITLANGGAIGFDLDESAQFDDNELLPEQRAVSVESFAIDPERIDATQLFAPDASALVAGKSLAASGDGFALERDTGESLVVAWHDGDIEAANLAERPDSVVARLTIAPGIRAHVLFRIVRATGADVAPALARVEAQAQSRPQVTPSPGRTP
jgi:hypothetical protein